MEEGTWTFKGKVVVLAPYGDFTRPSTIALNKVDIWIQMHDLPDSSLTDQISINDGG